MTVAPPDLSALRSLPFFDETVYLEGAAIYSELSVENYCRHGQELLNGATVQQCINATAGVRAVSNSITVYSVSPDGLVPLPMFYLVTLCEGILMPHLQPLVTLSEQRGLVGPVSKKGDHVALEKAKTDLGPAINFLATHAQPLFATSARSIGDRMKEYDRDRLSKLRNSIAHFNFRLEIERTPLKDDPAFPKDPKLQPFAEAMYEWITNLMRIHNPHKGEIVDSQRSNVRWEGSMGKAVTNASAALSFKEMRTLVDKLESFALSLAFAYVQAGCDFGEKVVSAVCTSCNEGHVVVPATETHATCPACGMTHKIPKASSGQSVPPT